MQLTCQLHPISQLHLLSLLLVGFMVIYHYFFFIVIA